MLKIKPEFWTKRSGEEFVILKLSDFEKVQALLEDAGLSRILRDAKKKEAATATVPLAEVKKRLGLSTGHVSKSRVNGRGR